jgi:predicted nucleic acid-binding protein
VEFLDTNILMYAASGIPADREKSRIARELVQREDMAISLQVLQEFYNAARRPKKLDFTHEEAAAYCQRWRRFKILEPTLALFDDALAVCKRYQVGFYDAAILAAASQLSCRILYSEDLSDGQSYGGVRVMNPFRGI